MPPAEASLTPAVRPGSLQAWAYAMRLKSLLIAFSPVVVGTAFAWAVRGLFDAGVAALALVAALLLQVVTNLQNDVGYTVRGAEDGSRTGLPRATANGWLSVGQVRTMIVVTSIAAIALGLPLVIARGWPVLLMGAGSLAVAIAYMGGPRPIAYTPFGELSAFVFFGLVAVLGSEYIQTGSTSLPTWLAAASMGAFAAAALGVNNHRDVVHDRAKGRRTFAVLFGADASRRLYLANLLAPFALAPLMAWTAGAPTMLLPLVLLPIAWRLGRDFVACQPGLAFNALLFRTFKLELAYALLLAIGAVCARLPVWAQW